MKVSNNILLIVSITTTFLFFNVNAQNESDLIHKTMQAEIQRNLDSLFIEGMQKPFYIGLNLVDFNDICIKATLGSIVKSREYSSKRISLPEVYVGNYELTNINYMDETTRRNDRRIPTYVPVETTSDGIAKAIWSAIDQAYKYAAEKYEAKMSAMKEQVISEEEKDLADLSKEEIVNIHIPVQDISFNKNKLENLSKELSGLFKNYPEIQASYTTITGFKSNIYFSNSEGSSATYPVSGIRLVISAITQAIDGEQLDDAVCYYALHENELPAKETMINDIRNMTENLLAMREAPVYDEIYNGPVLLLDQAAYELFAKSVSNIISSRKVICGDDRSSDITKNWIIFNNNLGQKLINKDLSIIANPLLKEYEGTRLLGYFPVDMQGVVPPEEVVLVKDGNLNTLFSSRQVGIGIEKSNGHLRFGYNNSYPGIGPSIVTLQSKNELPKDELKQKLIELAKEDDLEFAVIIRKIRKDRNDPVYIYKVDVETGNETMVRNVQLDINLPDYKKIFATSDNKDLYNVFVMESDVTREYTEGLPASFITYDGILFKSAEVKKARKPIKRKLPVVKNPVALKE